MTDIKKLIDIINEMSEDNENIELHDSFDIELNEHFVIETGVVGFTDDGIVLEADETTLELLGLNDVLVESEELEEEKKGLYYYVNKRKKAGTSRPKNHPKAPSEEAWKDAAKTAKKESMYEEKDDEDDDDSGYDEDDPKHPDYAERRAERADYERDRKRHGDLDEAEYQGRNVPLGKPMAGDVKKSKVYVKKPNGKVVKVNFGDKKMRIKKSNPGRRKNFRARHNCDNPGPRWKARYWSCRAW